MKLWHGILLTVGILMVIGGSLALILTIDNPRYAPGEATAIVERVYRWRSNSADRYSDLYEEYLGQGVWEVKSSSTYNGEQAVFRVYETTDTVAIYNATAQAILNRREELEQRAKYLEQQRKEYPKRLEEWQQAYEEWQEKAYGHWGPNPFE